MEKKFSDIIIEGTRNGKSYEEINAELKAAGANFHLDPDLKIVSGWTEEEMAEGFREGEPAQPAKHLQDFLGRETAKAGQTIRALTAEGAYDVSYDADGYAVKAVLVR